MANEFRLKILPVFRPLLEPARYKGARGGRGSGKSHFFADLIVAECIQQPGTRVMCIREVQKSLKESAKRLIEDKIKAHGLEHLFAVKSTEIGTPGGGTISFVGMQDHSAEAVKSAENIRIAWIEEAHTLSQRSLELLRPTIRAQGSEIWASWNPRNPTDPIDQLLTRDPVPENAIVVKANYSENPWFPDELEEERKLDEIIARDRYAHIWLGEFEPNVVGAIWDRQTIETWRRQTAPDMQRIYVAVDPAVSHTDTSDYHGIIVGGQGVDGRGYVLEDASMRGTPQQWAARAVLMLDKWQADGVIVERNQGGDMVMHTLRTVRPNLRIIEVTATRGKHVRAEPISAMDATGKISHIGVFPELEDQMVKMTAAGYAGDDSPDRLDARVWLFTHLFEPMIRPAVRRRTSAAPQLAIV